MASSLTSEDVKATAQDHRDLARQINDVCLDRAQKQLIQAVLAGRPQAEINSAQDSVTRVSQAYNDCIKEALRLDLAAIRSASVSVDIATGILALKCSTAKMMLAIKRIDDISNILTIITGFLQLGAAITVAAGTGGIATIGPVLVAVDNLIGTELKNTLSPTELAQLRNQLVKCA